MCGSGARRTLQPEVPADEPRADPPPRQDEGGAPIGGGTAHARAYFGDWLRARGRGRRARLRPPGGGDGDGVAEPRRRGRVPGRPRLVAALPGPGPAGLIRTALQGNKGLQVAVEPVAEARAQPGFPQPGFPSSTGRRAAPTNDSENSVPVVARRR